MGIREAWDGLLGRKPMERKLSLGRQTLVVNPGQAKGTPRRYDDLAREGYQSNIIVYRCVNLISECASQVPFKIMRGNARSRVEIENHPVRDLFNKPNPIQGGGAFWQTVYAYKLLAGNSYIELAAPESNTVGPAELWPLRPDKMKIVEGARGLPLAYEFGSGANKMVFPVTDQGESDILHIKNFHPLNDWYGMSPLEAMSYEIDQHNAAGRWNYKLLANGARPSGALIYSPKGEGADDHLSEEQIHQIQQQLSEHVGPEESGRPLLLDGGVDWREMSLSPKDMDWLEGRENAARDIAQAYDVPPQMIGIKGSQTFANMEQAKLSLYDEAVIPMVEALADDLSNWLNRFLGDNARVEADWDMVPALEPRRRSTWQKIENADFLTINEKREMIGKDAVPGGDVILVNGSMMPLETAIEPPEPGEEDGEEEDEGEDEDLVDEEEVDTEEEAEERRGKIALLKG